MKTSFRILLALFATACFTACNENDTIYTITPAPEQPAQSSGKKLMQILEYSSDGNLFEMFNFKYNTQGNVYEIKHSYFDKEWESMKYEYNWDINNTIIANINGWYQIEHTLSNGKIIRTDYGEEEGEINLYTYDENGQIEERSIREYTNKYIWNNDILLSCKTYQDGEYTIRYGNQKSEGFFPLFPLFLNLTSDYLQLAQPHLFGAQTTCLPTEIIQEDRTITFSEYQFDSDGYVKKVIGNGNSFIEFVWE